MSEIASWAGLRQASLYYWFRRKEEILAEIVEEVNRVPLEVMSTAITRWRRVRSPSSSPT
jgi:AcrR family transcriptional regulator